MKKIISLTLIGATTSLMAMYAEQAYLYKDPRIMGMGGANVAVGSYSTSVFSNPAGLATINKKNGYVVDILSIGVSATDETQTFVNDISDASDTGEEAEMAKILRKYSGEHFHVGVDNYTAVSNNGEDFAWSIGILAAADVNLMAHGNGSASLDLLETTSRVYGGVVLGGAKPFDTGFGRLDVGVGLKYITQTSYEGTLGITDLLDDDVADTLQEKYEKESSGVGLDLGVTLHPFADSSWHPAFGLSVLNIGAMTMDDNYGGQPMTVNIGASVTPEVSVIEKLVIAVDYVDLLNANKLRMYDYTADSNADYTDYDTYDFMKHLRVGAGIGLIDSEYFATTVNVGMYQGSYTAGLDMQLTIVKLNFATYEEEVGDGMSSYKDRRYMGQIGIGW